MFVQFKVVRGKIRCETLLPEFSRLFELMIHTLLTVLRTTRVIKLGKWNNETTSFNVRTRNRAAETNFSWNLSSLVWKKIALNFVKVFPVLWTYYVHICITVLGLGEELQSVVKDGEVGEFQKNGWQNFLNRNKRKKQQRKYMGRVGVLVYIALCHTREGKKQRRNIL